MWTRWPAIELPILQHALPPDHRRPTEDDLTAGSLGRATKSRSFTELPPFCLQCSIMLWLSISWMISCDSGTWFRPLWCKYSDHTHSYTPLNSQTHTGEYRQAPLSMRSVCLSVSERGIETSCAHRLPDCVNHFRGDWLLACPYWLDWRADWLLACPCLLDWNVSMFLWESLCTSV